MAERKRNFEAGGGRARRISREVSFNEDDFIGFVRRLRRKYPGEWIALRVVSRDDAPGETSGEIIGHDRIGGIAFKAAADHHAERPDDTIQFCCTDMALACGPGPGLARCRRGIVWSVNRREWSREESHGPVVAANVARVVLGRA